MDGPCLLPTALRSLSEPDKNGHPWYTYTKHYQTTMQKLLYLYSAKTIQRSVFPNESVTAAARLCHLNCIIRCQEVPGIPQAAFINWLVIREIWSGPIFLNWARRTTHGCLPAKTAACLRRCISQFSFCQNSALTITRMMLLHKFAG